MEKTGAEVETASQEPTKDTDTAASFTQAQVDEIVTKALQTREKNLKSEYEQKLQTVDAEKEAIRLQEAGKYKELWELSEKEKASLKLERETATVLSDLKMADLIPVFGYDTSTLEGRKATAEHLTKYVNDIVEKRVTERIATAGPAKSAPIASKKVSDMTTDEYQAYKAANKIH